MSSVGGIGVCARSAHRPQVASPWSNTCCVPPSSTCVTGRFATLSSQIGAVASNACSASTHAATARVNARYGRAELGSGVAVIGSTDSTRGGRRTLAGIRAGQRLARLPDIANDSTPVTPLRLPGRVAVAHSAGSAVHPRLHRGHSHTIGHSCTSPRASRARSRCRNRLPPHTRGNVRTCRTASRSSALHRTPRSQSKGSTGWPLGRISRWRCGCISGSDTPTVPICWPLVTRTPFSTDALSSEPYIE